LEGKSKQRQNGQETQTVTDTDRYQKRDETVQISESKWNIDTTKMPDANGHSSIGDIGAVRGLSRAAKSSDHNNGTISQAAVGDSAAEEYFVLHVLSLSSTYSHTNQR